MSKALPKTLDGAQVVRMRYKRTVLSLIKEAKTLKDVTDLPPEEYTGLVERLRNELEQLRTINERVIELEFSELPNGAEKEEFQNEIEAKEVEYFEAVAAEVTSVTIQLMSIVGSIQNTKSTPPVPPTVHVPAKSTTASRMAKIKFPTFSGDLRDYVKFKEQFVYFTKDLPVRISQKNDSPSIRVGRLDAPLTLRVYGEGKR